MGLGDKGTGGAESPVEGTDGDVDFPSMVSSCNIEAFNSLNSSCNLATDEFDSLATGTAFQMEGSSGLGYSKLTLRALLFWDLLWPARDHLS